MDRPLTLRPARCADQAFLWRMLAEAAHLPPERSVHEHAAADPRLAAYVDGWGEPTDLGVVAEAGGEPIGAAWARYWTDARHGYVHVSSLPFPELAVAVDPQRRQAGVGTALLRALQRAAAGPFGGLVLSVREGNPAVRLYERLGFVADPALRMVNRAGGGSAVMVWRARQQGPRRG